MHSYLVTATNPAGRRATFARTAASVEHARSVLERLGFTDIEFLDAAAVAAPRDMPPAPDVARPPAHVRSDAAAHAAGMSGVWIAALRGHAVSLGAASVAAAAAVAAGWPWLGAVAVAAAGARIGFAARGLRRAAHYDALLRATAEGDWDAAAQCLAALRAQRDLPDALRTDVAFRAAGMLAKQGDVDGALRSIAPLRDTADAVPGTYAARLAALHAAADRIDDFLALTEQAWTQAGKASLQQLDLAFAHARVGDHARVAVLLSAFDARTLAPLQRGVYEAAHGIRHYRRGDVDAALEPLERAVLAFAPFAGNPATWMLQGIVAGHYALALAAAGRLDEGRAALGRWERVARLWLDPAARASLQRLFQN